MMASAALTSIDIISGGTENRRMRHSHQQFAATEANRRDVTRQPEHEQKHSRTTET